MRVGIWRWWEKARFYRAVVKEADRRGWEKLVSVVSLDGHGSCAFFASVSEASTYL